MNAGENMVILRIPRKGLCVCIRIGTVTLFSGALLLTTKEISSSIVTKYHEFRIEGACMLPVIEDWQWIVETILQEASSETFKGMVMIAEVIRDRAETKYNSDGTIVGT